MSGLKFTVEPGVRTHWNSCAPAAMPESSSASKVIFFMLVFCGKCSKAAYLAMINYVDGGYYLEFEGYG